MTQVEYKSDSKEVVALDMIYPSAPRLLSLTEDPEIRRTRKKLIIILSILLALYLIFAIFLIVAWENSHIAADKLIILLGTTFTAILIYGFGILVAYRYAVFGLRIFAWCNLVGLFLTGFVIAALLFVMMASIVINSQTDAFGVSPSIMFLGHSLIAAGYFTSFIISIFIVKYAFKLAKLIVKNNSLFVQKI